MHDGEVDGGRKSSGEMEKGGWRVGKPTVEGHHREMKRREKGRMMEEEASDGRMYRTPVCQLMPVM